MTRPRGNARALFDAGVESLIVAVDLYNRPSEVGRSHGVVMLLQHSLEMLLKAAILKMRGRIRDPRSRYNYGFKRCVNIAETDLGLLTSDEAVQLRALEHHRDAATHDVLRVPENLLYFTVHGGVHTAVRVVQRAFGEDLLEHLPPRALPVAAEVPPDLTQMIQSLIEGVRELLTSGKRRGGEARSVVRSIANLEAALEGQTEAPSDSDVRRRTDQLKAGADLQAIFPKVAALTLAEADAADGAIFVAVRIAKDGLPVRFAKEGEQANVIKQVNDFEFYKYSSVRLGRKAGITGPKARALADHLDMVGNPTYHKNVRHPDGKLYSRYSEAAAKLISVQKDKVDLDSVWREYRKKGGR